MKIEEYLTNPDAFIRHIEFVDSGKVRKIITYDGEGGEELKQLHKRYLNAIGLLPSSKFSYAYKKGVKVKDALEEHFAGEAFIKLDIKGFFENIDKDILAKKLKDFFIDINIDYLFYKDHLPMGFVTSPKLSDFYLYEFDLAVEKYLKNYRNLRYTRYADDILISDVYDSFVLLEEFADFIKNKLKELKLELNESKTARYSLSKQTSVRFLGLNLCCNRITVSKWYILKTLNAFKDYYRAVYKKQDNILELKSIAYGYYGFIKENSYSSNMRFLKKYENAFHRPFENKGLEESFFRGGVLYCLDKNRTAYHALIVYRGCQSPKKIVVESSINGLKVCSLKQTTDYRLSDVKKIVLPKGLNFVELHLSAFKKLRESPYKDVYDVWALRPKKVNPAFIEFGITNGETNYVIKKVSNSTIGYRITANILGKETELLRTNIDERNKYLYNKCFNVLAKEVTKCKRDGNFERYAYVTDGEVVIKTPYISMKMLSVLQFIFAFDLVVDI